MLHELNTNSSIKPLTVQFVPLKVVTEGATWGNWARKYPPQGNGIPLLYVIRADGQMLYGQSGSKSGQELGQFMAEHLRQAGRLFNDRELQFLEATLSAAREHLEKKDKSQAVRKIASLSKLGTVGELQSYSRLALEADELASQFTDEGLQQIEEAATQLDAPETQFDAALALADAKLVYAAIPAVDKSLKAVYRSAARDPAKKEALAQAEAIQRALARKKLRGGDKLAVKDLHRVIERYPQTPAARLAAEKIAEITGQPVADVAAAVGQNAATAEEGEFRTWTDATGEHRIEAKLIATKQGWVQLETRAGKKISLPIKKLSQADQDLLAR